MKKTLTSLLAAGLMAPAFAAAQNLNYNYVDAGLAFYPDFEDETFFGLDATGSFAITPDVFVFGGMKYLTDDVDLIAFHIGPGYRFALDARTDIYGGLTLEYQEVDYDNGSEDDTALGVRGGLRHRLTQELELGGQIRAVTGDFDYVGFSAYAQYFVRRDLGLIGELDVYDGNLGLIGKVRFAF